MSNLPRHHTISGDFNRVISSIDLLDTFAREIDAAGARTESAKKDLMKGMKALWKEVGDPPLCVAHPFHTVFFHPTILT